MLRSREFWKVGVGYFTSDSATLIGIKQLKTLLNLNHLPVFYLHHVSFTDKKHIHACSVGMKSVEIEISKQENLG